MKQISVMIKPASSLCNMRCKYCFYANVTTLRDTESYGKMESDTVVKMLNSIRRDLGKGDYITFAFQGGEPTVAGLDYFRFFTEAVASWEPDIHVQYSLQTNGLLIDESWCRFLSEHNFLVGLSLDLIPECHNSVRVDAFGEGTYKRVRQALSLFEKYNVDCNVLCTLTNQVARYPSQIWNLICKLDIQYIQFTPCLDDLDKPGASPYALTPERFAAFYKQLYPLWLQDYRNNRYRSVRLFDDIINLMAFGISSSCGIDGRCRQQYVVEADGSVYPCDFYCLDEYRLGYITEETLSDMALTSTQRKFENRPHAHPAVCKSCQFSSFCGGNCKRMQNQICCSGNEYCGYKDLLTTVDAEFRQIAHQERMYQQGLL